MFERDGGVCSKCGLDTKRFDLFILGNELRGIRFSLGQAKVSGDAERQAKVEAELFQWHLRHQRAVLWQAENRVRNGAVWHADHIKAVVEGGGECDLGNLRTMCIICHKDETAKLAARRAKARKRANRLSP